MLQIAVTLVSLPVELQIALGVAVLFVVRAVLGKFLPEQATVEIAGILTTAVIAIVGVLLGLIPVGLEPIATALLNLLVVLVGGGLAVNLYLKARRQGLLK